MSSPKLLVKTHQVWQGHGHRSSVAGPAFTLEVTPTEADQSAGVGRVVQFEGHDANDLTVR